MSNATTEKERTCPTTTALGRPSGHLSLRFHGSPRDGQVVHLPGEKCAIGSGEHCTLRLEARGIRDVHCYILRGKNGTVVRRWSPDTRLNGRAFRDARLRGGDRLSIGSIEFEVLAEAENTADALAPAADDGRVAELSRRLTEINDQLRRQAQQHEVQCESWDQEKALLNENLAQANADQKQAAEKLTRIEASLEAQQQRWRQREAELLREHAAIVAQIEHSQSDQKARDAALEEARRQLAGDRKAFQARTAAQDGEHAAAQRQWKEMTAALEEAREAFDHERAQWQQRVTERQVELAELEQALADTRGQLIEQTQHLDQATTELEQERSEYVYGREQTSAQIQQREADLFRREESLKDQKRLLKIREDELEKLQELTGQKQDELDCEIAQLQNDRKEFLAWRGECEAEFEHRRRDLQDHQEKLESQEAVLTGRRDELDARDAELEAEAQDCAREVFEHRQLLEQQQEQLQAQVAELEGRRSEVETERDDLQEQWQALNAQRDELAAREAQLEDQQNQLHEQQDALLAGEEEIRQRAAACDNQSEELQDLLQELADKDEDIARRATALENEDAASARQRAELEAQCRYQTDIVAYRRWELGQLREELSARQASLESEAALLDDQRAEFVQRENEFATAHDSWNEQRATLEHEVAELRAAAEEQTQFIQELNDAVEQSRNAPAPSPSESTDGFPFDDDEAPTQQPVEDQATEAEAPASEAMEALAGLREQTLSGGTYEEDGPLEDYSLSGMGGGYAAEPSFDDPTSSDSQFDVTPVFDEALSGGQEMGEDVSIQDYMSQLMQRIQGESEADAGNADRRSQPPVAKPVVNAPESPTDRRSEQDDAALKSDEAAAARDEKLTELSPRAAAPEKAANLRAMRELANESARSAITTSSQRQSAGKVRGKFAVALACAVTGVVMLTLTSGLFSLATGIALLCFAGTGWFAYDGFKSRKQLKSNGGPM